MTPEKQRARRRQRIWLWLTAAAIGVMLLLLIGGTVRYSQEADRANRELQRQLLLNARIRQMQNILIAMGNAESGQRGYLLTGKASYLTDYTHAAEALPEQLDGLSREPFVPGLEGRVRAIAELTRLKLGEMAETIRLRDAHRQADALALVNTDAGQDYMVRARQELNEGMNEIRRDRDQATSEMMAATAATRRLALITVSALATLILFAAVQITRLATAQRRFAKDLSASEQRHRAIVEDQQELISLARPDGTFTYLNPAYAKTFQRDAKDMIGHSLYDYVDKDDRQAVRLLIDTVLRTGSPQRGINRMEMPDGSEYWVSWTNSVQRGPDGEPLLHSVGRDITQRRRAEDALAASLGFLSRTGRVAGVGGWEVNLETQEVHWSDAIRLIHEVPASYSPTLEQALAFYEPAARVQVLEALERARLERTPFDLELAMVTAKGRRVCVRAVAEAELDATGKAVRLVGAIQDITQRKELEERLAASERFVLDITNSLPVRVTYFDRDLKVRFMNDSQLRRIKRSRDEVLGLPLEEFVSARNRNKLNSHLEAALRGEPQNFEYEDASDSEPRLIQGQMIPDVGPDGQVKGIYTTGVDITELKMTERRLRDLTDIIEHTPDFIVQTDAKGRVQYLNSAVRRALGLGADQAVQDREYSEFNSDETNRRYASEIMPAVAAHGVWTGETTVVLAGRRLAPVSHMVIAHRDAQGRVARYSAIMRDISSVVAAREALLEQTATLEAVVEAIPAMVAVFDNSIRYKMVNRAFERWRDKDRSEVLGHGIPELFGEIEYERSLPWAQRALSGETVSYEKDYPDASTNRHLSISYVPMHLSDGKVGGFVAVAQDITLHRDEERRLLDMAERDALTGVLNRAGFNHYLETLFSAGGASSLALLYIDLDRFKPVNDTYGHAVGDQLLCQFAQRLQRVVRPMDAVARLGGDEFAIVLNDIRTKANADAVADKVVAVSSVPFELGPHTVAVGASVGVAFAADRESGLKDLLERADTAVYQAKRGGRGRRA